ncbi:anti-sigma factor [Streptomyces sp. NBC_00568]|uniref:anti-sigma factor family protein n=1 Tax=Streptomyces sp. NBC_00568 TaxID=2975779 RepID=UPI00225569C0|nr:hypothetical protein [Streptomyces sp. NBC_00568]MCX4993628.1 hypothetical protein [Streptomyces sp. NBC_00568]
MDCEQLKYDLAAAAMAGREESADALASHLEACPECREEQDELRALVRLLAEVEPFELDGIPTPDPARAIEAARTFQYEPEAAAAASTPIRVSTGGKTRRSSFMLAAAFAGGLLAGAGVLAGVSQNGEGDTRPVVASNSARTLSSTDASTGVQAEVGMLAKGWGTEVSLSLGGVTGPRKCSLVAVSTSGKREVVSQWSVPPKGYGVEGSPAKLTLGGSSSLGPADISAFEVVTSGGERLVRVSL